MIDSVQTLHAADLTGAAGSRRAGARGRRPDHAAGQGARDRGAARRPRDQGGRAGRARACSSTSSTACCSSRASGSAPTARCGRSRTASAPRTTSASSRCTPAAWSRSQDASARFVGEATRAPGSVVLAAMEGSRPLLVEVQALVSPSELVPPRRVVNGIDRNRLALVLAVLAPARGNRCGIRRCLRQRRRRRAGGRAGSRSGGRAGRGERGARRHDGRADAAGVLRGGRADRRAALGRATPTGGSRRRAKFGLAPVLAPGPQTPTLRAAVRAALGAPASRVAA